MGKDPVDSLSEWPRRQTASAQRRTYSYARRAWDYLGSEKEGRTLGGQISGTIGVQGEDVTLCLLTDTSCSHIPAYIFTTRFLFYV